METNELKKAISPILSSYGVVRASVFGSFATGAQKKESDIDLLIEFSQPIGLLRFIHLKHQLEDLLGRPVDLLEFRAIKPALRDSILNSAIPIYGKAAA